MRSSETFTKVMQVTRSHLATCGVDILRKNYKMNLATYFVFSWIVMYFIFSVYTCILKYSENNTIIIESFCMLGSVFQGIAKLATFFVHKQTIRYQCDFLHSVYVKYEEKDENYRDVVKKFVSRVLTIVKAYGYMCTFCYVIGTAMSPTVWLFTRRHLFVMQFLVPFVDPDTTGGYFITIAMQSTCLFLGCFGNCGGDVLMLVYFLHSVVLVDIFDLKTKEINAMSNANVGECREIDDKFMDLIEWHQTYQSFLERSERIFFWVNFVQVSTTGMNIVLTLVIIFIGDWPGAYIYIAISFAILYLYCGMGTLIEITNDRLTDTVYEIYWFNLTVKEQKAVKFMLMKSQSTIQMTVGGVAPLNVNTGLQVTKTIYSVFMMLLNLVG